MLSTVIIITVGPITSQTLEPYIYGYEVSKLQKFQKASVS